MKQVFLSVILLLFSSFLFSQTYQASPSNWLYPDGNSEGTKYQSVPSGVQDISNFKVKWSNNSIAGDVQPLIGNIINTGKIFQSMAYAPNEIAAVIAGKIVVIDALGRTHKLNTTPQSYLKNISVLFDTLNTSLGSRIQNPVILGLETIEFKNEKDSVAYTYIAGYDSKSDTVAYLKRLAIDLRKNFTNYFASLKPVWGKRFRNNFIVYATVNIKNPIDTTSGNPPYFRGLTEFNSGRQLYNYPLPDITDSLDFRAYTSSEISLSQPSLGFLGGTKTSILLPSYPFYPTPSVPVLSKTIGNNITPGLTSDPKKSYLTSYEIFNDGIYPDIGPKTLDNMFNSKNKRPVVRPYFIHANNSSRDSILILTAEQYKGTDSSLGFSKLHIFNSKGDSLTGSWNPGSPSFNGAENQIWSVAVGNADGISPTNKWLPYYPQYPGKEIIVTQSSRDFAVAGSKLFILKYDTARVPKPTPPDKVLFPFDTLASQRINGWVAAVNDLDGASDKKDEIVLVDGSMLRVVRLRDYTDKRFQSGMPFDTVFSMNFPNETISNVAISDIDGDSLNDLVVTTFFRTYLIGSLIPHTLMILPDVMPPMPICAGDTISFKWTNLIRSFGNVNIKFNTYLGGVPTADTILIAGNYKNNSDTVSFIYVVSKELLGKSGRFIVENENNPKQIYDSTRIYIFSKPSISIDPVSSEPILAGSDFVISGSTLCVDSLRLEYSIDSLTWIAMTEKPVDSTGRFMLSSIMPCLPIFNCQSKDYDSTVMLRLVAYSYIYKDTTASFILKVKPAVLPLNYDTSTTICPTLTFKWNRNNIIMPCDTISVLVSADGGTSYVHLENINSNLENYSWKIPLSLPDTIIIRFCCEGSCERIDTAIYNFKPKNTGIVSPNPFNPLKEELQICYQVPEETNITIRILDESNRIVAEPVKSSHRFSGIAYCDSWDGGMWDKSPAANGLYYLTLEFSNSTREVYPVFLRR